MAKFNTIKEIVDWFEVNYPRIHYRYEKSPIAIMEDAYLPMGRYMTISGCMQNNLIKTNVTDRYLISTSRGYWKNRNGKISFSSREKANRFVETIVKKFYKGRVNVEYESEYTFEIDEYSRDFVAAMEIARLQKSWIDEGNTLKDLTDYDYNNYLLSHHPLEFYGCFACLIGQYASRCVRIFFNCHTFEGLQREGVAEKPSWMVRKEAVKAAEEAARKAEIEAYMREHPNEENSSPDDGRFDRGPRNVWEWESSLGFFGDPGWYDE